jgi:hypothetical protein
MHFIWPYRNKFMNLDTDHTTSEVMLLLAGYLTGMATGAPIILY